MSHLWEFVLSEELEEHRYDDKGHTLGKPEFDPPTPTRLQWDLPAACVETIEASYLAAQALLADVDLRIYVHNHYGKGLMKKCRVSPDAFIQMALQLAYYRREEKIKLMQVACARHQRAYQDAMCGKGIDRHLFCLYVVSKYLEVDSPFLKEVLSEPWRLSTSQTPHGQTSRLDLSKHPKCISAGGGFGPVADDGYGDSNRFARQIEKSLADIRALFE
ncbi:hypothetical protein B566_EDAN011210 [Ephemera danica]|nr:hypothetical protein B566_EDAN011210 [Ephemera danica]